MRGRGAPGSRSPRVLVVVAVGVGIAAIPHSSGGPRDLGPRHYHAEGIDFDYPAAWTIHDQLPTSSGFGSVWAVIGTHAWPSSCGASDINCYYEAKLEPGTIAVDVGMSYMPSTDDDLCTRGATGSEVQGRGPDDPVATQTLIRVAGRPTLRTTYAVDGKDYYGSDEWLNWEIAPIGTVDAAYFFNAKVRGPGTDALKADLAALIASIRLTPSQIAGNDPSADCGAPFPACLPGPRSLLAPVSRTPARCRPGPRRSCFRPSRRPRPCRAGLRTPARPPGCCRSASCIKATRSPSCPSRLPRPCPSCGPEDSRRDCSMDGLRSSPLMEPFIARDGEVLTDLGGGSAGPGTSVHLCEVNGVVYLPTP